jgi:hypothetical protein
VAPREVSTVREPQAKNIRAAEVAANRQERISPVRPPNGALAVILYEPPAVVVVSGASLGSSEPTFELPFA